MTDGNQAQGGEHWATYMTITMSYKFPPYYAVFGSQYVSRTYITFLFVLVTLKVARSTSSSRLLYWEHNPKAMSTEATCCSNCVFLDSVLVYSASDLTAEVVHNLPWDPASILWNHLLQLTRIPRHYVPWVNPRVRYQTTRNSCYAPKATWFIQNNQS